MDTDALQSLLADLPTSVLLLAFAIKWIGDPLKSIAKVAERFQSTIDRLESVVNRLEKIEKPRSDQ